MRCPADNETWHVWTIDRETLTDHLAGEGNKIIGEISDEDMGRIASKLMDAAGYGVDIDEVMASVLGDDRIVEEDEG